MPIRLFTIPFSEETQTFHDDLILQFCTNKRIHKIETKFFKRHGLPYWTVAIHYGQILSEEKVRASGGHPAEEFGLDDQQKALLIRLKEWRKELAGQEGRPVYIICTNAHLASAIKNKCMSLESLKLVRGLGKKRIEQYGPGITNIIRAFYQGS
jgi:superfamily II DNA helicase RecQ